MKEAERILTDFGLRQAPHIAVLLGRIKAVELLLARLYQAEIVRFEDPRKAAMDLRASVLGSLEGDPDDPVLAASVSSLEAFLDALVQRQPETGKGNGASDG